ncbi:MAG: trypsin-like peptidase domain-containing protein [Planctomycetales bacterium]|nr:trypsin-like peptidase domain-containing protein [Planctomycetales bacterium]
MRASFKSRKRGCRLRQAVVAALVIGAALWAAGVCRGQCVGGVCPPQPGWQSAPPAPSTVGAPVSGQVRSGVCRVVNEHQGGASLGTGTLVNAEGGVGYVLTCEHLFSDGVGRVSVRFANSAQRPAELFARDAVNDVALLKVTSPAGRPLGTINAAPRDWLTTVGLGSAGSLRAVRGRVIGQTAQRGSQYPSVIIQGAVRQGDSGGPVLDRQDQVVGVVWGSRADAAYAMVGEPVRRLLGMIPRAGQQRPPSPAPPGVASEGGTGACPCEGNCVKPDDLAPLARRADLEQFVRQVTQGREQSHGALQNQIAALAEQIGSGAKTSETPLEVIPMILAGLGIGGPIGVAVLAGRLLLRHRRRTRRGSGGPREDGFR